MNSQQFIYHQRKDIIDSFDNASRESVMNRAFSKIVNVANTNTFEESFTSIEGMEVAEKMNEGSNYPTKQYGEGYLTSLTKEKYGNKLKITDHMLKKAGDSTQAMREVVRVRNKLLKSFYDKIEIDVHKLYSYAFATTFNSTWEGKALIEDSTNAHTWNTSTSYSFSNEIESATTRNLPLNDTAVEELEKLAGWVRDSVGNPIVVMCDTIVVKRGSSAAKKAKQIFANDINPVTVGDINIYNGQYRIIETPWLTNDDTISYSDTAYYAFDSRMMDDEFPLTIRMLQTPKLNENFGVKIEDNGDVSLSGDVWYDYGIINTPYCFYWSKGTATA